MIAVTFNVSRLRRFVSKSAFSIPTQTSSAKLSDFKKLFSDDLQVRRNQLSSPTTPNAAIVTNSKVMTWDEWVTQKTVVVRRTRRKEVVPEGQMGFGI